jgi:hypothetical protein
MRILVAGSNPSEAIVVPLRSKRLERAKAVQKLNHAVPALGLLFAGQQAIARGHEGIGFYLGLFELASAFVLIALTLRELRRVLRPSQHAQPTHHVHGIDWVDIAAGFVLVAEALEHWHVTHHVQRPTLLSAIATFALGLSHGRIAAARARKRVLRVDDNGIFVAGRPFKVRKLDVRWSEVASVEVAERWGVITTRSGRARKLDLPDLEGEQHVRHALLHARQLLGDRA